MSEILRFPFADSGGRPAIPRRQSGETLYDYLKRMSEAREEEIERLNQLIAAQDDALAESDLHTRRTVHLVLAGQLGFALSLTVLPCIWPGRTSLLDAIWPLMACVALVLAGYLLLNILPAIKTLRSSMGERRP